MSLILSAASSLYGAVAARRRRMFERESSRGRRLSRPVISVGNLSVGGTGKTPVVAWLAGELATRGERPAILTRGFGRLHATDGVTVVSDGIRVLANVRQAGDEPFWLATSIPGAIVLAASDRYAAGRLAERLGATVHVLDDGFQHLALERNVDVLLVTRDDLGDRLLPAGRLRESLATARLADALVVPAEHADEMHDVERFAGARPMFRVARRLGAAQLMSGDRSRPIDANERVLAVAGIARPERFFRDLAEAGWPVVGTMAFRDHHWFTARDLERVCDACRAHQASAVVTTEKDAVRLTGVETSGLRIASVPLTVTIEPASFMPWLLVHLSSSRLVTVEPRDRRAPTEP